MGRRGSKGGEAIGIEVQVDMPFQIGSGHSQGVCEWPYRGKYTLLTSASLFSGFVQLQAQKQIFLSFM